VLQYVHMCINIYINKRIYLCIHTYTYMHIYTYTHTVFFFIYMCVWHTAQRSEWSITIWAHAYLHMYTQMNSYMYIHKHVQTKSYTYTSTVFFSGTRRGEARYYTDDLRSLENESQQNMFRNSIKPERGACVVCALERERERDKDRRKMGRRERECVCACVCACACVCMCMCVCCPSRLKPKRGVIGYTYTCVLVCVFVCMYAFVCTSLCFMKPILGNHCGPG